MLHIGIRFVMFVNMKVGLHLLSSFCLMLYSGTDCLTERPQKQKMGLCGKIQNSGPPPFGNALYAKKTIFCILGPSPKTHHFCLRQKIIMFNQN